MDEQAVRQTLDHAIQLCQQRRFDDAQAVYRRALDQFGKHPVVLTNLAVVLAIQERFEEALPWHDRSVAVGPDYQPAHFNRGNTLSNLHRYAEAAESLEHAVRLWPNHAEAVSALAVCYNH